MSSNTETPVATEAYAVGPLDIFLLISFVGFVIYWLMKKNEERKPEITGLAGLRKINPPVQANTDTSGFLSKMKKSGKTIAIFYGSQTGTAEEFSQRLAKDSQRYGLKAGVFDPEECEMEELIDMKNEIENSLVIFVMATYGEGDPTDNALPFYDWLKEGPEGIEGLNYAVFALGNKTYEHYQAFGRYIDKRVEELGGVKIHEIGEGDDDGNIEEDFVVWREQFWESVCQHYGIKVNLQRSLSSSVSRDYELKKHETLSCDQIFNGEITKLGSFNKQRPPYDAKNPYLAKIAVNRELHKAGGRSCMHIELDISSSGIKYESGDHVGIYPTNDPELVAKIGELLDVDLDQVISLVNVDPDASKKNPFPCPCTYRTALLHYVDITTTVKHHVLAELVSYTKEPEEVKKLTKLSNNKEGKELYNEWIVNDSRHIVAVLEDLKTCKPPLDLLLELMPRLHCRYYSISSSPKMHKDRIHVTAVLVDWTSRVGRQHKGVATSWLKAKQPVPESDDIQVPIFVRHTSFRLPVRPISPVLMVGPGTGIAPFRGFIQERHLLKESNVEMGDTILFFGCRKRSEDFLYEEELNGYVEAGSISMSVAFSRDQAEKCYVTHKLKENLEQIWDVVKKGGHLYVCGDAKHMAKDVNDIFLEAFRTHGGKSEEQAVKFLKNLSDKGRYSVDVWS